MSMSNVKSETVVQHSAKFLRQRNFFMVLPALVLPFLIFLLWTVGLIGELKGQGSDSPKTLGLNMDLPSAAPAKDSNWNKMKYYEQAAKDSVRLKSFLKSDPYRKMDISLEKQRIAADTLLVRNRENSTPHFSYDPYPKDKLVDQNEERVYKKLAALNKELETASAHDSQSIKKETRVKKDVNVNADVARLETMMKAMQESPEEDPELKQLNELLEKIMNVQHPERMEDKIKQQSQENRRGVFAVERKKEDNISVLERIRGWNERLQDTGIKNEQTIVNNFYSLPEDNSDSNSSNAIPAVVHESQNIVTGSSIKMRLLEDVFIAGTLVKKDHFIWGTAKLDGERLQVNVSSIRSNNNILPVALSVYDHDGMPGIHVPDAITRNVAKRSAAQSVQNLGAINSLDQSLGAQLAGSGLQAAQNLFSKKARLAKVFIKAGYAVLLKDDNKKDN